MKLRLTPEMAELVGFWKMRRTPKGVGIEGNIKHQQRFAEMVLKLKLVPPDKIVSKDKAIWFSHIKIRNWFLNVLKKEVELFERKNKLSAAYLRGMYESKGTESIIDNVTSMDKWIIEKLGFYTVKRGRKLLIKNIDDFLSFIKE